MRNKTEDIIINIVVYGLIVTVIPFIYMFVGAIWVLDKFSKHAMIKKVI